ncbi:MAG: TonB-dependent receptor [Gammaproteobacteria bacterium]|nr:MAG: TonB-dependent receptor [Gammaproteobacteria bacterium]
MKPNSKISAAVAAILWAPGASVVFSAPADTAATATGVELAEVVVTAERRTERLQDVPITIQALTGDSLAQMSITTFDDVIKLLPNVTFSANGPGQGNIYMRGLSVGFAGSQSSASINPFPNVATYLDEQSLTFPARNLDVYMVDMERIEILEGPQGTLFGGGAEAGALRYITRKPRLDVTEGHAEASYGTTAHGDPNTAVNAVLNLPLIKDKLALRGVFYNDRRGGYIDNVPTTFTRNRNPNVDAGPNAYSSSYPAHLDTFNNYNIVKRAQNPTTYQGFRLAGLYQVNDEWNVLIQQTYQSLDAEGMPVQFPSSMEFTPAGAPIPLQALQETSFMPAWNKDKAETTAWTVNGRLGDLKAIYTGAYLSRNVDAQQDYTNYTRTSGGFYYTCVGGGGSNFGGSGPAICYSPVAGWHDYFETTHQSHELRLSTPDDWRLRGLVGAFWEDFQIKDDMNFNQKSIPSCTPANLAAARAGGPICLANVTPQQAAIDPTTRGDNTNFGEDLQRGYKQTAGFASLDFDLIPKTLTVTGGTRWYRYVEQEVGSQYGTGSKCVNQPNGSCLATKINYDDHHATFTGFKSRANLTWHLTPDAMLYYTYSQGYRPGAFNRVTGGRTPIWVDAAGVPLPNGVAAGVCPPTATTFLQHCRPTQFNKPLSFTPDSLLNNEIGFKSEFLSHRLLVNASIYQMDWKDVQTLIYNPPVYGNTTFGVTGPTYRIKGGELQFAARATEGLTLNASLSYNDSSQTTSPCIHSSGVTPTTPGNPTPAGACITQVRSSDHNVAVMNPLGSIGSTPAFSPKLQANARARYEWSAANDYRWFVMAGINHVGEMSNQPSSFQSGDGVLVPRTTWLRYTMPAYNTYDASIGFAKDTWELNAFGQNLSNSNASTFTTSGQDIKAIVPLRPRVLGLKIGFKF